MLVTINCDMGEAFWLHSMGDDTGWMSLILAGNVTPRSEGDSVAAGDVIGLAEVRKSFHEVKVETAGTLTAFLVEHEDAVTAGQPLARLD